MKERGQPTAILTTPEWGPEVREWGMRELGLRDPNGYFVTFTEPASPGWDQPAG
jgi:hypothetical protein